MNDLAAKKLSLASDHQNPWPAIYVACSAALISAVSPLLYSHLAIEGKIATSQIGPLVTCEFFALALGATAARMWLQVDRMNYKVALAAAIFSLVNLASAYSSYPLLTPMRIIAGLCEGIFIWAFIQTISRTTRPARFQGAYLAMQGTLGYLVISLYAGYVIPESGSKGGFIGLALISLVTTAVAFTLPKGLAPLPLPENKRPVLSFQSTIGLVAIALSLGGLMAIWVHLPALAAHQMQPPSIIGAAISFSLVFQVVGGLSAAALDSSFQPRPTIIVSWLTLIGIAATWILDPLPWLFVILTAAFGFVWMLYVPFTISYLIALDPSRRVLGLLPTIQPLGAGLGPVFASFAVSGADVRGAFVVGIGMLAAATICVITTRINSDHR
jgi:DHA1 family inner membrane transport protein